MVSVQGRDPVFHRVVRSTTSLKLSRINDTTSITGELYINGMTRTITQLSLPFSKIIDRPFRPPLEKDLVILEQELRSFAEDIWSVQTIPGSRTAFKLVYGAHLLLSDWYWNGC